jgi:RNA recognition motif-containing protein
MTLYVGNIAWSMTEDQLRDVFTPYGEVKSATIIMDRETGRSRGFGFVEMVDADSANQAISQVDGMEVLGRSLRVNQANPRREKRFGRS